jgi:hypothetical protein
MTTRALAGVDVITLGFVGLVSAVMVAATWRTWGALNSDTGYDAVAGLRIAHGQLPYLDFTYYYGPLAPFVSAVAVGLGGPGLDAALWLGVAIASAIVFATFRLARTYEVGAVGSGIVAVAVAALAYAPNYYSYVMPHTTSATLGTLLTIVFLLLAARVAERSSPWALASLGTCIGLITLTKPEYVLAVAGAAGVWFAFRLRRRMSTIRDVGIVAATAAVTPAIIYGVFVVRSSLNTVLFQNLYPVDEYTASRHAALNARTPWTLESAFDLGGRTILYGFGTAVVCLAAVFIARRFGVAAVGLAVGMTMIMAAVVAASDIEALRYALQFVYGWIPLGAILGVWFVRPRAKTWTATEQQLLVGGLVLAVLALTTYGAFFMHATNPQMAVYYMPFAFTFLAVVHLNVIGKRSFAIWFAGLGWLASLAVAGLALTLHDASSETMLVRGPGGALADSPARAATYQQAVDAILAGTANSDHILVVPLDTALYALTLRSSPVPRVSLLPGALPDRAAQQAVIAALVSDRTPLIITDVRPFPEYGETSFGKSFDRVLAGWIRRHYFLASTFSSGSDRNAVNLEVWKRSVS